MTAPGDPRSTRRWKTVSKLFIEQEGTGCVVCGTYENLSVDHIQPYSLYPELFWEESNWQVMCRGHNGQKSNKVEGQTTDYINPVWIAWESKEKK